MLKRNVKFTSMILGLFLTLAASNISPISVSAASNRLWGQNRYETATAISKEGWTSADYVIVASGEGYADALCAAPLSKKYNAPIILTESSELNEKAKEEIKRLNAKHVFIIGKYGSVSEEAEKQISALVADVKRLGGKDRFETSVIVAKELGSIDKVTVTSGYGFADALSIASIAAQSNMPILLTNKDQLPEVVQSYINDNRAAIKNFYAVGGIGVISDAAASQMSSNIVRLSGKDRFETNLKIMEYFKDQLKFDSLYVVQADGPTGKEFADALSGSALAAKTSSPMILTYNTVSEEVENFVKTNSKSGTNFIALGGEGAVPETLVSRLANILSGSTSTTGGQVISGGGAGSTGGAASSSEVTQLKKIATQLTALKPSLKTQSEKDLVSDIIDSINNCIENSDYDYASDAKVIKAAFYKLSADEQSDLKAVINKNISNSDMIDLAEKFGLL